MFIRKLSMFNLWCIFCSILLNICIFNAIIFNLLSEWKLPNIKHKNIYNFLTYKEMILQGVVNPDNNCQENGQFSLTRIGKWLFCWIMSKKYDLKLFRKIVHKLWRPKIKSRLMKFMRVKFLFVLNFTLVSRKSRLL